VGGLLYVEGIICLLVGLSMLLGYWPPYAPPGKKANPVSLVGAWITGGSLAYMVLVGLGFFIYNLLRPGKAEEPNPLVERAERYAQVRGVRRSAYLWDETICCEEDAAEADLARQII